MSKRDKSKAKLFRAWKQHLSTSRLSQTAQVKRAKEFTRKGMEVPSNIIYS